MPGIKTIIGSRKFETKIAADNYIRALKDRWDFNGRIQGEDHLFLMALLALHPKSAKKIGVGVDYFEVRADPFYGATRCFYIVRTDGSSEEFSYKVCLSPKLADQQRHPDMATASTAVPTRYNGIEFRSRLEARWATFFDLLGWNYEYEPIDGVGYIPDFWIDGVTPFFLEVKPAMTMKDLEAELPKVQKGLAHMDVDAIIVGAKPLFGPPRKDGNTILGMVACERGLGDYSQVALWSGCRTCGAKGWRVPLGFSDPRPCGCFDAESVLDDSELAKIEELWKEAGNLTQWKGRLLNS